MNKNLRNKENLKTLQQNDPFILNIIDQTIGVTVYSFDHDSSQWEEILGQGPFFLVKSIQPFYTMVLLDQKAYQNLTLTVTSYDTIEVEGRLVTYTTLRQGRSQIVGLRFHYQGDIERILTNIKM
ncbi:Dcp1-like decapping [Absidia repens]|uniref:Dcp1-like decapping n=1 Tax=Absidia repens TaxID=90262 RepID=A0A1X2HZN1_9FUNG|nr:Dcp1-like decapping [Absidia repens]